MAKHTMLYRVGNMIQCGPHFLDWIKVESDKIEDALANGWHRTPQAAQEAHDTAKAEPVAEPAAEAPAEKPRRKRTPKKAPEANDDGNAD